MRRIGSDSQRGATLLVALVMLVLLTLMVSSAFTLSTTNLKSVNNMQMREEAMAAANSAIELVISSNFTADPDTQDISVDLNNSGTAEYTVAIEAPTCISYTQAEAEEESSVTLGVLSDSTWDTLWEIKATVNHAASGTNLVMRQGVLVRLGDAQKTNLCS